MACMRDLVSQPGIEPGPPAWGGWSLTHWTTREVPGSLLMEGNCWGWGGLALVTDGATGLNLHPSASDGSSRPNPISLVLPQGRGLGS